MGSNPEGGIIFKYRDFPPDDMAKRSRGGDTIYKKRFARRKGMRKSGGSARAGRSRRGWATRSLNVHRFSRYAATDAYPNIAVSGTQSTIVHVFALQDIVNSSEFTALFDQFYINKVVVTYQLLNNPNAANALNTAGNNPSPTNWYPTVWSIADYDDGNTTNVEEMKQRIGVRRQVMKPDKIMRFTVRPKVQVQLYKTALTTAYGAKRMWVDMSYPDTGHYGLKTVIDTNGLDPNDTYPFIIRQTRQYFFTCKNVR